MRIFAALLLCTSLNAADWIKLTTAGVELFTDTSEKSARLAIRRLEDVRRVLPPKDLPEPVGLRIFLFKNKRDYQAFAPNAAASGFYQSGPERDYIALFEGATLPRVVVHEYVHFALRSTGAPRPQWLEEGLAELYSNVEPVRNGVRIGTPIEEHRQILSQRQWLTAAQLNAPKTAGSDLGSIFYAQSWALVHMFVAAPEIPEVVTPQMLLDLRAYLSKMHAEVVPASPAARIATPAQSLSPLDGLLVQAEFALRTGHTGLARTFFEQAAREYPNSAPAARGLGMLARAENRPEEAQVQLLRSIGLNDRDASAWFEFALLENDHAALERAVTLNPDLGEAHALLGTRATDDGDLTSALAHLEQATRLMPRKSYVWYSLGYAQDKAGQRQAAIASLESALRTAISPEQVRMAQTLLDALRP